MDELLGDFITETRETLEPLAGEIVAWEAAPDDRKRLDAIFRFVHTVKGSCGFLDLPRLEKLSHAAESALAEVRDGERVPDRALVSAVLAIIDRIGELVESLAAGEPFAKDNDDTLIHALEPGEEDGAEIAQAIAAVTTAQAAPAAITPRVPARSIRLPVELLDRMMAGVSDMVLARNELSRRLRESGDDGTIDAAFERLSTCVAEMRESITRTRMQRIDGLFSALPRMVRDLSAELGKQVQIEIDGSDVELDREMIEMIRDPLTHIVRNSIDHGIEHPTDRKAVGKPAAGMIRVDARQSGNHILIEVSDDGKGIDDSRLVEKAITTGLVTRDQASNMTRRERLELIFSAGLSTAAQVTAISGRGVGMDVVRANVERIGGVVEIDSVFGHGVKLTLRVPMTLTIIPALTFSVGSEYFAIPRGSIDEIARAQGGSVEIEMVGGAPVARIRGERLPVVHLAALLGLESHVQPTQAILVVVRASSGERYALAVDGVQDHEELVVKPAAPAIMATGVYGGTTLPDNGRPMLIINPAGVAQVAGVRAHADAMSTRAAVQEEPVETIPTLLFRGLDDAPRAIRLGLVERIEDVPIDAVAHAGGHLTLAHDGRILPLFGCEEAPMTSQRLRVLLLGDGTNELAYAIGAVIDIHDLPPTIEAVAKPGMIAGVLLVEDRQVELLDPYWLFAQCERVPRGETRPLCLLDGSDPWMRDVLRPIIEQAGYRVDFTDSAAAPEAAVAILAMARSADETSYSAHAPVIRLRASADDDAAPKGSIYRYDRGGLIAALTAAQQRQVAAG